MDRSVFDVIPDGNSWIVKRDGETIGGMDNKPDAVVYAKKEAQSNLPSQLVVRRRDGTFEEEQTFGS